MRPFDDMVEEHGAVVLRVCRALLGPDDAQDAWSETFLAALRAYPDLRPDSNVEGWLVTIAHRKSIDLLRRRARHTRRTRPGIEGADGADVADQTPGPEAGPPGRLDDDLLDALRALPAKQQAAVVHHYLAGLPYREVGQLMGTSTDAARRSAADGISALRATLTAPPPTPSPTDPTDPTEEPTHA